MELLIPAFVLVIGCSSTTSELTPSHQFYSEYDQSFSESCLIERERIKISEKLFSVGNTVCEIETFEDGHSVAIKLKNCVSGKEVEPNKTVKIRTTYNSTVMQGWFENPREIYSCRIPDLVRQKNIKK